MIHHAQMGIGDFSPTSKTDRVATGFFCRFFACVATHALLAKSMRTSNYVVLSDVFVCPSCSSEIVFYDAAVDREKGKVNDSFG